VRLRARGGEAAARGGRGLQDAAKPVETVEAARIQPSRPALVLFATSEI